MNHAFLTSRGCLYPLKISYNMQKKNWNLQARFVGKFALYENGYEALWKSFQIWHQVLVNGSIHCVIYQGTVYLSDYSVIEKQSILQRKIMQHWLGFAQGLAMKNDLNFSFGRLCSSLRNSKLKCDKFVILDFLESWKHPIQL